MGRGRLPAAAGTDGLYLCRDLLAAVSADGAALCRGGHGAASDPGEKDPDAQPRRLCGSGPQLGAAVPVRGAALCVHRRHDQLYRRPVRDGLRPDHHRLVHLHRCVPPAPQRAAVALADPVDGRHGCAGAFPGADAEAGRGRGVPHARRKPRPHQVQAGAQGGRHRQDTLSDLCGADPLRGAGPASGGRELVLRRLPQLYHHGHRRLLDL